MVKVSNPIQTPKFEGLIKRKQKPEVQNEPKAAVVAEQPCKCNKDCKLDLKG